MASDLKLQLQLLCLNPNRTPPPPLDVSRDNFAEFFFTHRAFATLFFRVLRNFWRYFRTNWAYRSEVTQRYVIERRLKIWEFSGFVYKT